MHILQKRYDNKNNVICVFACTMLVPNRDFNKSQCLNLILVYQYGNGTML